MAGGGGEEDEALGQVVMWDLPSYQSEVVENFRGVAYSVAVARDDRSKRAQLVYGGVKILRGSKVGFVTRVRGDGKGGVFPKSRSLRSR